ncbi:MAG: hypothetical protein ACK5AY_13795 [Bacteroidota bacterium]
MRNFLIFFLFLFGVNLLSAQAVFVNKVRNGNWWNITSWTLLSGTDPTSPGVPDGDDDVIIDFTCSMPTSAQVKSLTINAGDTLNVSGTVSINGDFTNSGVVRVVGTSQWFLNNTANFNSVNPIVSSTTPYINWNIRISGTRNFLSGTTVSCAYFTLTSGATLNNFGNLTTGTLTSTTLNSGSTFNNDINSTFTVGRNIAFSGGTLLANANPNTVIYTGINVTSIRSLTYHNLAIDNGSGSLNGTKNLLGAITTNGNFTIASNVVLNCAGFNINCNGNWVHNGTAASNDLTNQGIVTFSGTSPTVTRTGGTERLATVQVSPSTSLTLGSDIQCGSLTLNSGSFDLSASNFTCHITGNMTTNAGATVNPRNGKFRFIGSSPQTISGSGIPTFYDLVIRNAAGVSVTGNTFVTNLLTDSLGNIGTSGSGTIRLVASSPTQYGRIGPVIGSLSGTGWTIDSYIDGPAQTGWQYLSSPISGITLADWDNDPRFYTSGVTGNNDGNACCGVYRSVYKMMNTGWVAVTTITEPLTPGRGFCVYVGDNPTQLLSPLIYNSVGTPNFSNVSSPSLIVGGPYSSQSLVGNPYACPIDFTALAASNTNINSAGYYMMLPNGASVQSSGPISPNQGFVVNSTGGVINFTESMKNVSSLPSITRLENNQAFLKVKVRNDVNGLGAETSISFAKDASNKFDFNYDLPYLPNIFNFADNIWTTSSDGEKLLLNKSGNEGENKSVTLHVKPGVVGVHNLDFITHSFDIYNCIWIENLRNGERVYLNNQKSYSFSCSDTSEIERFLIHFENRSDCNRNIVSDSDNDLNDNTLVFNNGSGVFVKFNLATSKNVNISILNILGQELTRGESIVVKDELLQLSLPEHNQFYLVKVQTENEIIVRKIFY